MLKRIVYASVSLLLALTVVGAAVQPVGTIASGNGVTVSGNTAAPGHSLFSGDTLSVRQSGTALLLIDGGSRVVLGADSVARIVREGSSFALEVTQGRVAFTSSSRSLVEGRVADATFVPKDPSQPAVGYISFQDSSHPVFFADKGVWLLSTSSNGRTVALNPGTKLGGVVAADNQDQNDQQKKKRKKKWAFFWIGGPIAGTVTGLGLAFGQSECTSPYQGAGCQMSPVRPQQ